MAKGCHTVTVDRSRRRSEEPAAAPSAAIPADGATFGRCAAFRNVGRCRSPTSTPCWPTPTGARSPPWSPTSPGIPTPCPTCATGPRSRRWPSRCCRRSSPARRCAEPPDDEVLQAAMNLAVGAEVPAAYRTLVREQTGIGPVEPLAPLQPPPGFHVVIIGAGVTGVLAGPRARPTRPHQLHHRWRRTRSRAAPGGRTPTPAAGSTRRACCTRFTFDQDPGWPEHFSRQPELLRYVKRARRAERPRRPAAVRHRGRRHDLGRRGGPVGARPAPRRRHGQPPDRRRA